MPDIRNGWIGTGYPAIFLINTRSKLVLKKFNFAIFFKIIFFFIANNFEQVYTGFSPFYRKRKILASVCKDLSAYLVAYPAFSMTRYLTKRLSGVSLYVTSYHSYCGKFGRLSSQNSRLMAVCLACKFIRFSSQNSRKMAVCLACKFMRFSSQNRR